MIFVFGSNLAGVHGAGAAKHAHINHGAQWGVGEGLTGNSYAIPTKDEWIETRSWPDICASVDKFLKFAALNDEHIFLLTPIGCGLAGLNAKFMWQFIQSCGVPNNVVFSAHWSNDHSVAS
jgi:hypothetical protein